MSFDTDEYVRHTGGALLASLGGAGAMAAYNAISELTRQEDLSTATHKKDNLLAEQKTIQADSVSLPVVAVATKDQTYAMAAMPAHVQPMAQVAYKDLVAYQENIIAQNHDPVPLNDIGTGSSLAAFITAGSIFVVHKMATDYYCGLSRLYHNIGDIIDYGRGKFQNRRKKGKALTH